MAVKVAGGAIRRWSSLTTQRLAPDQCDAPLAARKVLWRRESGIRTVVSSRCEEQNDDHRSQHDLETFPSVYFKSIAVTHGFDAVAALKQDALWAAFHF